uniref:Uncharacterized protein n=1 Tax=Pseudopediastrum boryanum TaxID=55410 RepID=A0A2U8GK36_PSEBY|nr:hypothetical protein [Pseudopediastrum boryanum]AWI68660.1 hypothetical protein [Pseudopediastrum boryanum]
MRVFAPRALAHRSSEPEQKLCLRSEGEQKPCIFSVGASAPKESFLCALLRCASSRRRAQVKINQIRPFFCQSLNLLLFNAHLLQSLITNYLLEKTLFRLCQKVLVHQS